MVKYYCATNEDRHKFDAEGYILVPGLLTVDETKVLAHTSRTDMEFQSQATARSDASGAQTVLAVRDHLHSDIYSRIVRSRRVAASMQTLLGDEVYHYHHKLMLKEPRVGGAWEWHQDYGYWYNYGCLFPTMASCYIAIDRASPENGCLEIIPRSHLLGRLDHGKVGGQTGADPERIQHILERFPKQYVTMNPGDGLFFHGNLLHCSGQNRSDNSRWSLICCYNTKNNSPYQVIRHNGYTPLDLLDDEGLC